jgi:hypothetical protein
MICPECKAEYRDGFDKCSDCDVDLVDKIVTETEEYSEVEETRFKTVMTSFNQGEIALAKSLLESSNIQYFIQGESFNSLLTTSIPVWIKVTEEDFNKAAAILKELI